MTNYLLLLGTFPDLDNKKEPSPKNKEVLDIALSLQKNHYTPTLILAEEEVRTHDFDYVAPYLARTIGLNTLFEEAFKKKMKFPYIIVPKTSIVTLCSGSLNTDIPVFDVSEHPREGFMQYGNEIHFASFLRPKTEQSPECIKWTGKVNSDYRLSGYQPNVFDYLPNSLTMILSKLEDEGAFPNLYMSSPFGEGGRCLDVGAFMLASSAVQKELKIRRKKYVWREKPVYFLESMPLRGSFSERIKVTNKRKHIDYYVNGFGHHGEAVLIVDPEFHRKNREMFRLIEKEQRPEMVVIPNNERSAVPANSLILPDHKVLMAAGTPKTQRKLEEIIGSKNIINTIKPINRLLRDGYGLRCITNLIMW